MRFPDFFRCDGWGGVGWGGRGECRRQVGAMRGLSSPHESCQAIFWRGTKEAADPAPFAPPTLPCLAAQAEWVTRVKRRQRRKLLILRRPLVCTRLPLSSHCRGTASPLLRALLCVNQLRRTCQNRLNLPLQRDPRRVVHRRSGRRFLLLLALLIFFLRPFLEVLRHRHHSARELRDGARQVRVVRQQLHEVCLRDARARLRRRRPRDPSLLVLPHSVLRGRQPTRRSAGGSHLLLRRRVRHRRHAVAVLRGRSLLRLLPLHQDCGEHNLGGGSGGGRGGHFCRRCLILLLLVHHHLFFVHKILDGHRRRHGCLRRLGDNTAPQLLRACLRCRRCPLRRRRRRRSRSPGRRRPSSRQDRRLDREGARRRRGDGAGRGGRGREG
eukprot:Rhum_TRINITY_DN14709_c17_g1::Rhum_TRINITY_DN14709_c17_g1_i1::g.110811::m.110811